MTATGREPRARWALAVLVASLMLIAAGRLTALGGLLPYSQHTDETFFTASIVKMIRNQDANPRFFRYPSLPLYLSTTAVLAAAPFAGDEGLEDLDPAALGAVYSAPRLFAGPRILLALVSVGALALLAAVAWTLFGPWAAVLTPWLFSVSGTYQVSAVQYLNVDVVTVFFVAATLAVVFRRWDDTGYLAKSVWPGLLAGMVVASKYNSGLVLVPCGLAIYFAGGAERWRKLAVLALVSAGAFFVCVPYSLIDAGFFVEQVLFEIDHYRTGRGFANSEPGIAQLRFYLSALTHDFGLPLMVLALIGAGRGLVVDRARTLTLLSLPVLMLLHMSTNSVNFLRTILPVYAVVAVLQAGGVVTAVDWVRQGLRVGRPRRPSIRPVGLGVVGVVLLLAVLFTASWGRLLDRDVRADPRNRAVDWLRRNAAPDTRVLVFAELGVDPRRLRALGAEPLSLDLNEVEAGGANGSMARSLFVLPELAEPRPGPGGSRSAADRFRVSRSRLVQERIERLEGELGGRVVFREPGRKLELGASPGRPARPAYRPSIRIVEVGG